MLKEFDIVRVLQTGMYGTIVDMQPGEDHCIVEFDEWEQEAPIDDPWQMLDFFKVAELEALVEVGPADRKALFSDFEIIVLRTYCYTDSQRSPTIVIRRAGNTICITVKSRDFETNESKTLEGVAEAKLASAIFATRADRWQDFYQSGIKLRDGYSWTLDVYAGNRYFSREGENVAPSELTDLLYAIADIGLPLAWDGSRMILLEKSLSRTIQTD